MISIITPTHKRMPLVEMVVESVMNQTYTDWEWVVLDTAEVPFFKKLFDEFLKTHPIYEKDSHKVKIFEKNMTGFSIGEIKREAINHISCKSDEWTIQLDHDDILFSNALEYIDKCDKFCGTEIDYMSADRFSSVYDINTGIFYSCWYSDSPDYKLVNSDPLHVGNWALSFPVECAVRYNSMPAGAIPPMHPRVLRSGFIKNPAFAPGIVDLTHEDLVQMTMVGYLLRGAWIESPLIMDVTYRDDDKYINTSRIMEHAAGNDTAGGVYNELKTVFDKVLGLDYRRKFIFFDPKKINI